MLLVLLGLRDFPLDDWVSISMLVQAFRIQYMTKGPKVGLAVTAEVLRKITCSKCWTKQEENQKLNVSMAELLFVGVEPWSQIITSNLRTTSTLILVVLEESCIEKRK